MKRILTFFVCLYATNVQAQYPHPIDSTDIGITCGMTQSDFQRGNLSITTATLTPADYPPSAIYACGHFTLYYEDIKLGLITGYADPIKGAMRRNNLCSVLQYIESVFDFSGIPSGGIRIEVQKSTAGGGLGYPNFIVPPGTAPTVDGFVADYMRTKVDPAASTQFHGELSIDFDKSISMLGLALNEDFSRPAEACESDLATWHLHYLGHILGVLSHIDISTTSFVSAGYFSSIDRSIHVCPDPATSYAPMSSLTPLVDPVSLSFSATSPSGPEFFWVNGQQPPGNHGVEFRSIDWRTVNYDGALHFADYRRFTDLNRISPGDYGFYVMGFVLGSGGVTRHQFSKGELETFVNIIGLHYNSTYLATHYTTNKVPYSQKMFSDVYNHTLPQVGGADVLPPDYTITNDVGSSLTIDLSTLTDLVDGDGDPISIYPGSLVNFRGCGDGTGNNHNALSTPANNVIIYTPRSNFYGLAQFGFNLSDGKEKGAFVWFTIRVNKGTNVTVPPGGNLVLNPSFEEGSEVRTVGSLTRESVNNSIISLGGLYGNRFWDHYGIDFPDAFPYISMRDGYFSSYFINNASGDNRCVYAGKENFGAWATSFPALFPGLYAPPAPHITTDGRYMGMDNGAPTFMYLGDELQNCKYYELSFYGYRISSDPSVFDAYDEVRLGFTDDAHLTTSAWSTWTGLASIGLVYSPTTAAPALTTFSHTAWKQAKIRFTYCSANPSNVLKLDLKSSALIAGHSKYGVDELSLREVPFSVSVAIAYTEEGCKRRLIADPDLIAAYGCNPTYYVWKNASGATVGTGKELVVDALTPMTYTVTADDGCGHTASASVSVDPCPCSPYVVFGGAPYTTLTSASAIPSPLPAGKYYVASDISIPASNTFSNSLFLMEPDVAWNVGSAALLTISNSHLFTCRDTARLWKGITLVNSGSQSARISVTNNSFIEDAVTAIKAVSPRIPASGNVITINNSIFNRNAEGVSIENFNTTSAPATLPFECTGSLFTSRDLYKYSGYPAAWASASALRATFSNTAPGAPLVLCRDYLKVRCKNDTGAYVGIYLKYVGSNIGTGVNSELVLGKTGDDVYRNVFDNLGDGVTALFTNLSCYNNDFANMNYVPGLSLTRGAGATGITIGSSKGFYNRLRALGAYPLAGQNSKTQNRFYDCLRGIKTSNMWSVTATLNQFQTSNTIPYYTTRYGAGLPVGIEMGGSNYTLRQADQNDFYNVPTGMQLSSNAYTGFAFGQTNVYQNNFVAQPPAPVSTTSAYYCYQGIVLDNIPWLAKSGTVSGTNAIYNNYCNNVYNGVLLQGLNREASNVTGNTVNLRLKSGEAQYGFGFTGNPTTGSVDLTASGNTVTGLTGTAGTELARSFYAAFNTNLKLCSNESYNTGRGFEFAQLTPQPGTRWISNGMTNHKKGMVLGSDIGHQGLTLSFTGSVYFGASLNRWNGSTWSGSNYNTYADAGIRSVNSRLYVRNITGSPAELPGNNWGAPSSNRYINPASLSITTLVSNCDGKVRLTVTPFIPMIISDSLGYDSTFRRNQWMAQLGLYLAGLEDSSLRDSSAIFARFMDSAANSRYAWIGRMDQALSDSDTLLADSLLNAMPAASGYRVVDSGLVITDYAEADTIMQYYRSFYKVYLHTIRGQLGTADTNALEALTLRCPGTDGAVVYRARSLYAQWTGQYRVYGDDYCNNIPGGPISRAIDDGNAMASGSQAYSLFPNPNNGSFAIRQQQQSDEPVTVRIYNSVGMLVQKKELVFVGGLANFTIPGAVPGMYLACVSGTDGTSTCLRFTIH